MSVNSIEKAFLINDIDCVIEVKRPSSLLDLYYIKLFNNFRVEVEELTLNNWKMRYKPFLYDTYKGLNLEFIIDDIDNKAFSYKTDCGEYGIRKTWITFNELVKQGYEDFNNLSEIKKLKNEIDRLKMQSNNYIESFKSQSHPIKEVEALKLKNKALSDELLTAQIEVKRLTEKLCLVRRSLES
jgi:hypothetical protein